MVSGGNLLYMVSAAIIGGGILVYATMIYNGLVKLRRNIDKAKSNIDVLLKQRNDEIPKLVDTAQEYMEYEQETLNEITEARTKVQQSQDPKAQAEADQALRGALGNFFAVAEDYPDLKSTEQFQQLQNRISDIENQISDRREFYNDSVTTYNTRIHQIPYNFMAGAMNYNERELFEATEQEKQDIDMEEQFN